MDPRETPVQPDEERTAKITVRPGEEPGQGGSRLARYKDKLCSPWCANMAFLLFAVALVACLAFGFVLPDRAPVALIAVTVLLVAMAFTQLDKFESIKGGGVEFKLRRAVETAERASAEARATTEHARATTEAARATSAELRTTAGSVAKISLELLASDAALSRIPDETKLRIRKAIDQALRRLGVPEGEIAGIEPQLTTTTLRRAGPEEDDAALVLRAGEPAGEEAGALEALERALVRLAEHDAANATEPVRYRAVIERIGALGPGAEEQLANYDIVVDPHRPR